MCLVPDVLISQRRCVTLQLRQVLDRWGGPQLRSLLAIAETLRYELSWSEDEGWPVMAPSHALPSDRLVGATRSYCPSTNDSPQGRVKVSHGCCWPSVAINGKKLGIGLANGPEQVQNSVHS